MDESKPEAVRPPLRTYEGLARMIDHSMVRPELTDEQIEEGCLVARRYQVISVSARPSEHLPVGGIGIPACLPFLLHLLTVAALNRPSPLPGWRDDLPS